MYSEVGAKVSDVTGDSKRIQSTHRAVGTSYTRTVESMDDVSNSLPSGENATSVMRSLCPCSLRTTRPVATSITRMIMSSHTSAIRPGAIERHQALKTGRCPTRDAQQSVVVAVRTRVLAYFQHGNR
jgi:hypothetical protein